MKTNLKKVWIFFTAAVFILTAQSILADDGGIVVIVNVNNPISSLTKKQVKLYYLKKTKKNWDNGEKIRPIDLSGNPNERQSFLSKVLDMSAESVERYWIEQQYSKAEKPPKRVDDSSRMINLVGTFKGAIGFVNKSSLTSETQQKVKTVYVVE